MTRTHSSSRSSTPPPASSGRPPRRGLRLGLAALAVLAAVGLAVGLAHPSLLLGGLPTGGAWARIRGAPPAAGTGGSGAPPTPQQGATARPPGSASRDSLAAQEQGLQAKHPVVLVPGE
jgi:hypothetical protein